MQLLPHVRFANLYGPTETNVCTCYEVPRWPGEPPASIPIGKPIADVEVVRGRRGRRVSPPGEVGELYVRGPTVMQGYWGDRSARRDALPRTCTGPTAATRVYRTGDLVHWTRTATGSSSAGATPRSRAAATASSWATSRRR